MPPARSDQAAADFSRVALAHLDPVYTAALYLAGDPDRAADLAQETFLRAFRFFHRFTPGTNCRAWLLTILHNIFRNRYRADRRERGWLDIDDPLTAAAATRAIGAKDDPESLILGQTLDGEVAEALKSLPEEFRSTIVLVDLQDLTYEESARILDCPVGTVRSRLSRGRHLLQSRLYQYAARRGVFKR